MFQDVFIIGATGNVGRTLVKQIFENGDTNQIIHKNPTRICGIASSFYALYDSDGLTQKEAWSFLANPSSTGLSYDHLNDFISVVETSKKNVTFIDVTAATEEMLRFHTHIIKNTSHRLVTANKLPLVLADFKTFCELTAQVERYGFRCSVMAGAEAVNKVRDLKDLGDTPIEISGCFSGTLGYIASELEKGKKFSDIISVARKAGYTEPNPADDLSGFDVTRKILILARTSGYQVENQFCHREPFVPESYLNEKDPDVFCESLRELDNYFETRVATATNIGKVLRYIATFAISDGQPHIHVGLQEVAKDSPLGSLQGTRNKIIIKTKTYSPNFYSVEAPGAGLEVTAQNIRRDLLDQISRRVVSY